MVQKEFVIENEAGLHARPAAKFTRLASSFKSEIRVIRGSKTGNGKSLLSVLALGIFKGTPFTVCASGSDEVEAMIGIQKLIDSDFKEEV